MRSFVVIAALAGCSGVLFAQAAPIKMGSVGEDNDDGYGEWHAQEDSGQKLYHPRDLAAKWSGICPSSGKAARSTTVKNARGYTFTATCKTPDGGTMVTSGSETIQDSEHIISQSHTTMTTSRSEAGDRVEIHEHVLGRRLRQGKAR